MTEPCSKEMVIAKLQDQDQDNLNRLIEMEKRQIGIGADVSHIKGRIDNGIANTVSTLNQNVTRLMPVIERHTALEKRIEDVFWWIVKILIAGAFGIGAWAIASGWKP